MGGLYDRNKATIPYYDTRTAELGHIEENNKEYNKKDGSIFMGVLFNREGPNVCCNNKYNV